MIGDFAINILHKYYYLPFICTVLMADYYWVPIPMLWTVNLLWGQPVYSMQSLEPPDWCRTCTVVLAAAY